MKIDCWRYNTGRFKSNDRVNLELESVEIQKSESCNYLDDHLIIQQKPDLQPNPLTNYIQKNKIFNLPTVNKVRDLNITEKADFELSERIFTDTE
ncbi:hypothetical protein M153_5050004832 [Pseudoloma neurophilia]|uniref:Uncharacterized protein n=1 Tax=Pseudoloma neurophilia TaxID=146866 RepID=A0A0R0M162_9MICR|nr:hypothetical protein M153_5050004832 [Pseudoloma neurophilia]